MEIAATAYTAPKILDAPILARHIRRMRALYAGRQAALVEAAQRNLAGLLDVQPAEAGMHLVGWLPDGVDDQIASQRAAAHSRA